MTTRIMIIALAVVVTAGVAGAATLAEFNGVPLERLEYAGFELSGETTLQIHDVGFGYRSGGRSLVLTNAWILDAATREPVWEMTPEREEWNELQQVYGKYNSKHSDEIYSARLDLAAN